MKQNFSGNGNADIIWFTLPAPFPVSLHPFPGHLRTTTLGTRSVHDHREALIDQWVEILNNVILLRIPAPGHFPGKNVCDIWLAMGLGWVERQCYHPWMALPAQAQDGCCRQQSAFHVILWASSLLKSLTHHYLMTMNLLPHVSRGLFYLQHP